MELSANIGLALFRSFFMQFLLFTSAFSKHAGNNTDRLSLLEFRAKVIDPLGVLNSWNESLHFCMWQGITCSRRHDRVTILDVHSSQLGGYISPHVGNLSFLRWLDLGNNSFSHEIPGAIGRLFRLQVLVLGNNSLSGTIPVNISRWSNLQFLHLAGNNLTGEIPKGMDSLSLLKNMYLGWNNLDGEIPSSICNLSNSLEQFSLEVNNLHGSIPKCFDQLKRLVRLAIGGNDLCGTIPPSMYNLSSIRVFSFHTNRFQGNLPPNLGHLLPNLESFLFHTNQLTGPFPIISNASNLVIFEILGNHFTGKVPDFLGLPNLKVLSFGRNNLGYGQDGDLNFLFSLVNCTNLDKLGISDNNFGGVLPKYMSNFSTTLSMMALGRNQIKGSIPTGIGNLVNLQELGLEENQLVGKVPSMLGKLKKLYGLALQHNKLSGSIPSSLGNLTSMGALDIHDNNFQGILPSSLGECKNLLFLLVSQNNLSGPLPKEVIGLPSLSIYLVLSQNHFTGSIPKEVGNMVSLGTLDISENKLSGEIPETLGGCESLEYLYLGGNLLQGSIPQSLDSLKAIEEIDLSCNNLSGRIPTYMIGFRFLQILNLSFNNFEGEIPTQGIFTNTSGLSVVGNEGLCGGIPQLHLPKCTSTLHNKHKHLSSKQKLAVLVVCGLLGTILLVLSLMLLCWSRKSKGKSIFGSPFGMSLLEVSYKDLVKATSGFSSENLIGCGSFGSVYKGSLNPEKNLMVAVKVFNLNASRAFKSFMAECKVLKSVRHRNLVKILTACSSIDFQGNDFKALVYEFMINGSLEERLHPSHGVNSEPARHLSLTQRINIAIDVANALDYMHHHCHVPIVHSDIKPSNILLDGDMTARVGDFGLARFLNDPSHLFSSYESSSIGIKGSIGYIAPEYVMGGELSREGDVYSYGILLLEMFTGKRPTDEMFKDDFSLHNFVKMSLPETIAQVVDSALLVGTNQVEERQTASKHGDMEIDHIEEINIDDFQSVQNCHLMLNTNLGKALHSVLKIGIACSEKTPTERMNMGDVIKELLHVKTAYMGDEIQEDRGQELAKQWMEVPEDGKPLG